MKKLALLAIIISIVLSSYSMCLAESPIRIQATISKVNPEKFGFSIDTDNGTYEPSLEMHADAYDKMHNLAKKCVGTKVTLTVLESEKFLLGIESAKYGKEIDQDRLEFLSSPEYTKMNKGSGN